MITPYYTKNRNQIILIIVLFICALGLNRYIALDSFINKPEKIFYPENKWALSIFYKKNIYPLGGILYFSLRLIITAFVIRLFPKFLKWCFKDRAIQDLHITFTGFQHLSWLQLYKKMYYLPFIYFAISIAEAFFNLYLINQYSTNGNILDNLSSSLKTLNYFKLVAFILNIIYLIFQYLNAVHFHKITTIKKRKSLIYGIRWSLNSIFKGNYASIAVSVVIFYLILNNAQGKTLLVGLILSPWNMLFLFIPLIVLLSLMALINSYYVGYRFYRETKEKGPDPDCKYFNWNLLKDKEAIYTRTMQANIKRYLTVSNYLMAAILLLNLLSLHFSEYNIKWLGYVVSIGIVYSVFSNIWRINKILAVPSQSKVFMPSFSKRTASLGIFTLSMLVLYIVVSAISASHFLSLKITALVFFFWGMALYVSHIILIRRSFKNFSDPVSRRIKIFLARDKNFIKLQRSLGIVVAFFSLIQFFKNFDFFFNHIKSINTILLFIFFIFWLFFIVASSIVFAIHKRNKKVIALMNLLIVILIGLTLYSFNSDNQYFTVKLIPQAEDAKALNKSEDASGITLKEYLENRLAKKDSGDLYIIANEGGGLRANYWSLLILNKLQQEASKKNKNFFDQIILTSGASGGSIGQSLYNLMQADSVFRVSGSDIIKPEIIHKIGNTDHLSSDLFSLWFRRPIVALIPVNFSNSTFMKSIRGDQYAANRYLKLAVGEQSWVYKDADRVDFKTFWKKAYLKNQELFPLTLINSTHIEYGRLGVGAPLTKYENETIFNSSVSYLEIDEFSQSKSISFLNSIFLSNRFPVVSSPAIIPSKGHFMDAGVFDNYGISSVLDLIRYIQRKASEDPSWEELWLKLKKRLKLIIISSGKVSYIKSKYDSLRINYGGSLFDYSNLKGTFGAAVSVSAVKEYLTEETEKMEPIVFKDIIQINLPYFLSDGRSEVQETIKIQLKNPELDFILEKENKLIKDYLKSKGYKYHLYFTPPLGRFLSEPVADYIMYMADYVMEQKSGELFN